MSSMQIFRKSSNTIQMTYHRYRGIRQSLTFISIETTYRRYRGVYCDDKCRPYKIGVYSVIF